MDLDWSTHILTILVVIMIAIQMIHLAFSIYSYFFLRNKQLTACKKGEFRGIK
jgi:hypothetical protein